MAYLLAVDQGTTSSRAIIFNADAKIIAKGQQEIHQTFPQKTWVEQDPEEIFLSTLNSIQIALEAAQLNAKDILAMGITNQRETTLLWDAQTGKAVYPAIVWQDRRTFSYCERLKTPESEKMIQHKTGLLLDPYFSASKIVWILENVPEAKILAKKGDLRFGTVETWLLFKLTHGKYHLSDVTNASRTLLFNIHTLTWDQDLLDFFNIPIHILPKVVDNIGDFGHVHPDFFNGSIPICAMMGDQQSAAFGQACFHEGMIKTTFGTGCFMLLNTGKIPLTSQHHLISTVQYQYHNTLAYGLEGSIFIAGAAIKWLRDNLKIIRTANDIEALATTVPNNGGVYFVPALAGLGAPYWDPQARGMIAGLSLDSEAGHLAHAALEAVAYQTQDLLQAMQDDGASITQMRVDGGMTVNRLLLHFLADILQMPIELPYTLETTALGIAFLIGLHTKLYASLSEIECLWQQASRINPEISNKERDIKYAEWQYWINKATTAHL
jgi:glycerol kinase